MKQNWEIECSRMGSIYANAIYTLAACDAPDDTVGFLNEYPIATRFMLNGSLVFRCIATPLSEQTVFGHESSALSKRGWALQEKLLCARTVAFKQKRMQRQCNTHYRSDDIESPYKPGFQFSGVAIKPAFG